METQDIQYGSDGTPTAVIIRRGNSFAQTIPLNEANREFRKWRKANDAKPDNDKVDHEKKLTPAQARASMMAAGLVWPFGE